MLKTLSVVLLLAASGCLAAPAPSTPPVERLGCPTLPEDVPFDCENNALRTTGIQAAAPGPETGWLCVQRYRNAAAGVFDLYVHQDGRIAYGWDLHVNRPEGVMVVQAGVYYGQEAISLTAAYQPKGFAVFDQKKRGDTADVHMMVRHFRVDVKEGEWRPLQPRLLVNPHQGDAWFVLGFDAGRGEEFVSPMQPASPPRAYEPDDLHLRDDGREIFVDLWSVGSKYPGTSIAWASTGSTRCLT